ncbi:hypothetical protein GCM10009111_12240 [Colwellia asteriadis]|uniref:Group 1 truncated hemoglobin n=1 Tax=Colwellia asteriadis TaxID=517723 RepID=A0ABN1L596_9GAMM
MLKYFNSILIILLLALIGGCSGNKATSQNNLYYDVGERQGIERLVDAFIQRIGQDETILPYFAKSSVSHFRAGFIEHFCDVIGGPCQYQGDTMKDIHTGMNINEASFNRIVELLILAMEDVDISYPVQNKILARLALLRSEVIHI